MTRWLARLTVELYSRWRLGRQCPERSTKLNAQEVHDKLESRLQKVENFKSYMFGAFAVAGVSLSLLGWIFSGMYKEVAETSKSVALHETRLSTEEKNHKELESKYEKDYKELYEAHNQLRRNIIVLWDRQPKQPPHFVEAIVFHGRIESISPKELALLPDEIGDPVYQFSLPQNTLVSINHKPAKIADLKVGMKASVTLIKGKVDEIQAERSSKPKT